ncbi:hypothetical protein J4Q44_G00183960, partial [Coregonus suidteri]
MWVINRSRLPPKMPPLLVRAGFGVCRDLPSSHCRSSSHHSICFVLFITHTWFISTHQYLNKCSLCPVVFVCDCLLWRLEKLGGAPCILYRWDISLCALFFPVRLFCTLECFDTLLRNSVFC